MGKSEHLHHHHHHHHHHGEGEGVTARGFVPVSSEAPPAPFPAGAGVGRLLYVDPFSGISGDMTIAALVSLGVPESVIRTAVEELGLPGVTLKFERGRSGALAAVKFDVIVEGDQPERSFLEIDQLFAQAGLAPQVRELARAILRRLGEAEARVHGIPLERVHFHEVGAVDSIVDILGAATGFVHLGATVVAGPLPLSRGFVTCRHGTIPLPAPAAVECLAGALTTEGPDGFETVTPTGAAIIATVANRFGPWPVMRPLRSGWGAGSRTFPDRPNVLRMTIGELATAEESGSHVVLEANVDDLTGELAGHVMRLLLEQGALDVWSVPVTTKKGRPGLILSAICEPEMAATLQSLMLTETTTLGVRRHETTRRTRPRRIEQIETRFGMVPVKISEGPFGPPQIKPEFDACAALAEAAGLPVREVLAEVQVKARARFLP
jgi:pyridinium-3,5-bisthiocarboxylic acid mononucleotide nickel chelatase